MEKHRNRGNGLWSPALSSPVHRRFPLQPSRRPVRTPAECQKSKGSLAWGRGQSSALRARSTQRRARAYHLTRSSPPMQSAWGTWTSAARRRTTRYPPQRHPARLHESRDGSHPTGVQPHVFRQRARPADDVPAIGDRACHGSQDEQQPPPRGQRWGARRRRGAQLDTSTGRTLQHI